MRRFEGRAAVVTGGGSGIGRGIGKRLAQEGASVLIADINEDNAAAVAHECCQYGTTVESVRVDVRSSTDCDRMVKLAVDRWGGIDVLVNSAGIGRASPVSQLAEQEWDDVVDTNLKGVFLSCKAAFPAIVARGAGAIINLASLAGLVGVPGMGAYCASKGGVVQLTRVMALEGAPHQVRVNALCPIWIDTPMVRNHAAAAGNPEAMLKELVSRIPLGRIGTVEDVAAAALFLASDEASFLTGLALPVDGGAFCRS